MVGRPLHTILWNLRKTVCPPPSQGVSDAQLLNRFLKSRDESAFELLVWRHGPMVLHVCGRVLTDSHAQEDAFQATFLTLVRKAGSIGKHGSVGSWLYKVAYRIALRARNRAAIRAARERPLPEPEAVEAAYTPPEDAPWHDLRPVLDQEVQRLPEKYRAAFVLCYLEGKSNEEAAEELGCPQGTVFSRLARAREMLRDRLSRRGVMVQAGPFGALLADKATAREPVSRDLAQGTASMAVMLSLGKTTAGRISASVLEMMEGVLKEMSLSKAKLIAAVVVAVALGATGADAAVFAYKKVAVHPTPVQSESGTIPWDTGVTNGSSGQGTGHCGH